ncbi:MAG: hypothetical protein GY861_12380 [bacterium]|nr:hypothetical protein [bacterium]
MMKKPQIFESYPIWMVIVINILTLSVFVAGAFIMFTLSPITGTLYLAYLIILEAHNFKEGCVNCCYYGKLCAFGKGKIAKIFLRKGDPKKFKERELTWKDFVPQVLVILIPLIVGIALLISRGFNIIILIALLYPVLSWFAMNPIIYGKLACPHCKQGSICCPALKFFAKKK